MTVYGRVIDGVKKSAIEGATVTVLYADKTSTGVTVTTDAAGNFKIINSLVTLDKTLLFEHPNYYSNELPVTGAASLGFVVLVEKPAAVPEVVQPVEPAPAVNKTGFYFLLLVGGLIVWDQSK